MLVSVCSSTLVALGLLGTVVKVSIVLVSRYRGRSNSVRVTLWFIVVTLSLVCWVPVYVWVLCPAISYIIPWVTTLHSFHIQ